MTPDEEQVPTVAALPDAESSPADAKKPKIYHLDGETDASSSASESNKGDVNGARVEDGDGGPGDESMEDGDAGEAPATPVMQAVPLPEEVEEREEWFNLKMSWSGKIYDLRVGGNDMIYDFRAMIQSFTNVPPVRQKLIGLTKGKLPVELDPTRFGTLGVKDGTKFTMIGTPEDLSFKDPHEINPPEVRDDFDIQYPSHLEGKGQVAPAEDPRNIRRVQQKVKECPITIMNEPRPGKRLLVLDLDYTMVDTKPLLAGSLPADECARPGLHDFLEQAYEHYDIVIWSQTHWRWVESKLVELGILGGTRNYKVCFVADRTSMFPIFSLKNGQPYKHEVKPLAYFWASFPQWSAKNTIHIDDLSRNFALNPGEGLRIRAFNQAGTLEGFQDCELVRLSIYLSHLATNVEDFTTVDHSRWKKGPRSRPHGPRGAPPSAGQPGPPAA